MSIKRIKRLKILFINARLDTEYKVLEGINNLIIMLAHFLATILRTILKSCIKEVHKNGLNLKIVKH